MATLINIQQQKAQALKERITTVLHWTELEYTEFQYEAGLLYLRHYIPQDTWGQDMLQRSRLFWNWWKAQWVLRDDQFCFKHGNRLHEVRLENRRVYYRYVHDAATLASEIYPGRLVLDDGYCTMISQVIKEELNA